MPIILKHLEAGCLHVNLMSTKVQINQLKYTILYNVTLIISWSRDQSHHNKPTSF